MNKGIKRESGFTLIEVLMAIVIFSVVMTALFSSFKAFIVSSETVKNDIDHNEKIRGAYNRISLDLESVYIPQFPIYKRPEFNSDPDPYRLAGSEDIIGQQVVSSLTFTSFAHAVYNGGTRKGLARISYYLKKNENDTYNLHRSDTLWPFPEETAACSDPVLLKGITGFSITYTDTESEEFRNWNSDDEEFDFAFPKSLEFKITHGLDDKKIQTVFAIPIRSGRPAIE